MSKLVAIALGGAVGALLRYFLSGLPARFVDGAFPWGTLLVNVLGSFLIGVIWVSAENKLLPDIYQPLLITGLLGALTTFSSHSLDNLKLIESGATPHAIVNLVANSLLTLLVVFLGASLTRAILQ